MYQCNPKELSLVEFLGGVCGGLDKAQMFGKIKTPLLYHIGLPLFPTGTMLTSSESDWRLWDDLLLDPHFPAWHNVCDDVLWWCPLVNPVSPFAYCHHFTTLLNTRFKTQNVITLNTLSNVVTIIEYLISVWGFSSPVDKCAMLHTSYLTPEARKHQQMENKDKLTDVRVDKRPI